MLSRERVTEERVEALLEGAPGGDERERELARILSGLRSEAPVAPEALRERVRSLAASEREGAPSLRDRLSLRRTLVVLAAATVVAALGGAALRGIVTVTTGDGESGGGGGVAVARQGADAEGAAGGGAALGRVPPEATSALPPSRRRAQDYRVFLRLHVEDPRDLSKQTKRALRLTRRYGGYVVSVDYGSAREGHAALRLRVPIGRVQDAVFDFSNLGTIREQQVAIRDLQGRVDRYTRGVARLNRRIAELRGDLRDASIGATERARLEAELARARETRAALRAERAGVVRRASFASVSLELTTDDPLAGAEQPGRIEQAFRDAGAVLVKEVALIVYVLIVAAPFLVLAGLALAAARAARRRADQRLLERA